MSENNQIIVVVHFKAKAGKEHKVKAALTRLVAPTRAEAGCIEYTLQQNSADKTQFLFYEIWKNQQVLDEHNNKVYIQEAAKFLQEEDGGILAEPFVVSKWQVVA